MSITEVRMPTTKRKLKLRVDLPIKIKLPKSFTREPLFLLLKGFKLNEPWVIFFIAFIVGFLDDIVIGAITGNWRSHGGVLGVFELDNISALTMSLIVEPGLWSFFVGFPPALFELFKTIQERGILTTNQKDVQTQVNRLESMMSSWVFRIAALLLALGIAYYAMWIVGEYHPTPWFYFGWHYWFRFARIVGTAYITVYAVSWSLIAIFNLYSILSTSRVIVNPYDGDSAGGLRFIGTFILKVSRLVLIVVPFLVAETLYALRVGHGVVGQFNVWLEVIVIPSLLAVMIFLPLTACRRAMFAAKNEFLEPLRKQIEFYVAQTAPPKRISKSKLDEITALIDFQNKLRKDFPTWPFDMTMSQQIGLSFVLSLIPVIFSIFRK